MAEVKILILGFVGNDGEGKTCPTITLVRDKDLVMVVDPGILESQQVLIEALHKQGLSIDDVTHVFITHSHLDHYRNIGMFVEAKTVEHFGVWDKGVCEDWSEQFTPNVKIVRTPGHNYDGLSLLVKTEIGTVAIVGDVFWSERGPKSDPYASDPEKLQESREQVSAVADYIIPGHGDIFKVNK